MNEGSRVRERVKPAEEQDSVSKTPLYRALNLAQPYENEETKYAEGLARIRARKDFVYDVWQDGLIRTLKIVPGERDDPLECYLFSHTHPRESVINPSVAGFKSRLAELDNMYLFAGVEDSISYEALSYTWGSDEQELFPLITWPVVGQAGMVRCDTDRAGLLYIRKNLRDFLVEMRTREQRNFLWIDAVCINQKDHEDITRHLGRMKHIYRYPTKIWIWLGKENEGFDHSFENFPSLANKLFQLDSDMAWTSSSIQKLSDYGLPAAKDPIWATLRRLLTFPWWSRIWTLQEVNRIESPYEGFMRLLEKPSTLICGSSSVPFSTVEILVWAISRAGLEDWILSGRTDELVEERHAFDSIRITSAARDCGRMGTVGLRILLQASRRRNATFPQDIILGQAGLHYDSSERWIKELGISITDSPRDVFITFAKYYLSQEMGECLLNHVNTKDALPGLPSWCPNFASRPEAFCIGSRWRGSFGRGFDGTPWVAMPDDRAYRAGFTQSGKWRMPYKKLFWAGQAWVNGFKRVSGETDYFDVKKAGVQLIRDTLQIKCEGVELGTVAGIVDCNTGLDSTNLFTDDNLGLSFTWLAKCMQASQKAFNSPPKSDTLAPIEILARTLVANRIRLGERLLPLTRPGERIVQLTDTDGRAVSVDDSPEQRKEAVFDTAGELDFAAHMSEFMAYCKESSNQSEPGPELSWEATKYARMLQRISRRRRFFTTKNGRIGIGPSDTLPGDILCVVLFCPTPYLLRKVTPSTYRLVGEVYVHGLMYGEALDMLDQKKVSKSSWTVE